MLSRRSGITGVGAWDVTLPGDTSTSNLEDGDLLNLNATGCPDGALLTNGGGAWVDSVEKTSSTLARATSAAEWRDPSELGSALTCQSQSGLTCPANTATPGAPNPTQVLECPVVQPYGSVSRAFVQKTRTLLD